MELKNLWKQEIQERSRLNDGVELEVMDNSPHSGASGSAEGQRNREITSPGPLHMSDLNLRYHDSQIVINQASGLTSRYSLHSQSLYSVISKHTHMAVLLH